MATSHARDDDADKPLIRFLPIGLLIPQLTTFFISMPILASSATGNSVSARSTRPSAMYYRWCKRSYSATLADADEINVGPRRSREPSIPLDLV
jgi:hypothetical protein